MNDAVSQALAQRQPLDEGFAGGVLTSIAGHFALFLVLAWGVGARAIEATGEPPIIGVLWPVESVHSQSSQPLGVSASVSALKPATLVKPRRADAARARTADALASPAGTVGSTGDAGSASLGPGDAVSLAGLDPGASPDSWYLAAVRGKIWAIWIEQARPAFENAVTVEFSIQRDGTLADLAVVTSSGSALADRVAQRAVLSAAPFAPLPESLAGSGLRIRGVFRP